VFRDGLIVDELWELVEPVMPSRKGLRGRPCADGRKILEGIAWRFRTGSPWRDVPERFGPWKTVYTRHHRFSLDGTYLRMFDLVREHCGIDAVAADETVVELLSIDSTAVRAHQHSAGAPKDPGREMALLVGHTGG